jgi:hypothetical protein
MNYKLAFTKQILFIAFLLCLAFQGIRGLLLNSWNITRGFIQLRDLGHSEKTLKAQNKAMIHEIKKIRNNPDMAAALKGSKEFNLVQDPENEIIINYTD